MAEALVLDPSMIVAELGCGPAFTAEALAPRVRRLVGFEIAPGTVEALAGQDLPANLDIVAADLCDTNFFAGFARAFDLVYSTDTLEHVSDPATFFATVGLVMREDATAVVLFPNEAPGRRHGVTSFGTGGDLLAAIGPDLELARATTVARSGWATFLHEWGWRKPMRLGKRGAGLEPATDKPQTFDETVAGRYGFARRRSFALLNGYGRALVALSGRRAGFTPERLKIEPDTSLLDRYLWLELRKKA